MNTRILWLIALMVSASAMSDEPRDWKSDGAAAPVSRVCTYALDGPTSAGRPVSAHAAALPSRQLTDQRAPRVLRAVHSSATSDRLVTVGVVGQRPRVTLDCVEGTLNIEAPLLRLCRSGTGSLTRMETCDE